MLPLWVQTINKYHCTFTALPAKVGLSGGVSPPARTRPVPVHWDWQIYRLLIKVQATRFSVRRSERERNKCHHPSLSFRPIRSDDRHVICIWIQDMPNCICASSEDLRSRPKEHCTVQHTQSILQNVCFPSICWAAITCSISMLASVSEQCSWPVGPEICTHLRADN